MHSLENMATEQKTTVTELASAILHERCAFFTASLLEAADTADIYEMSLVSCIMTTANATKTRVRWRTPDSCVHRH